MLCEVKGGRHVGGARFRAFAVVLVSHLRLVRGSSVEKSIECDSNRANREPMLPSYANKTVFDVHYPVLGQNRQAFS